MHRVRCVPKVCSLPPEFRRDIAVFATRSPVPASRAQRPERAQYAGAERAPLTAPRHRPEASVPPNDLPSLGAFCIARRLPRARRDFGTSRPLLSCSRTAHWAFAPRSSRYGALAFRPCRAANRRGVESPFPMHLPRTAPRSSRFAHEGAWLRSPPFSVDLSKRRVRREGTRRHDKRVRGVLEMPISNEKECDNWQK